MSKKLLITRTIEYTFEVPFTSEYYPAGSIDDAVKAEKEKKLTEIIVDELDAGADLTTTVEIINDES